MALSLDGDDYQEKRNKNREELTRRVKDPAAAAEFFPLSQERNTRQVGHFMSSDTGSVNEVSGLGEMTLEDAESFLFPRCWGRLSLRGVVFSNGF